MFIECELNNIPDLKPDEPLGFDTETDGFYGKICVAQLMQEHWDNAVLVFNPDPYELAAFLSNYHLIGQNLVYDVATIQEQTSTKWTPKSFDDTFYAARLYYYTKDSFSLDDIAMYSLKRDVYKELGLDKKDLQDSDWTGILTKAQKLYAACDVFYIFDIFNCMVEAKDYFNYKLDILFAGYCMQFQRNGLAVDEERLLTLFEANEAKIKSFDMPINVNSWKQVRPYIGEEQSDGLALAKFALQGNERAGNVNETRKLIKQQSFLKKFDSQLGRIFGKFSPSARSGRATCKDQNLQQLPRKTKGVFGVKPDSGRVLVYADYAQLELRCVCAITGESRMEKLFRKGEDLHGYTAEMLFSKEYTKEERQIAKTANFNLLYGGSHGVLGEILIKQANLLLPEHILAETKRKWKKLWPTIAAWQERGIAAWRHGQAWQTPLGRRYTAKMMTDQLNIQVQGFGAEVAKLATHYMMPRICELNEASEVIIPNYEPIELCNFIHDSWIYECDNDPKIYKRVAKIIAESMQEAWFEATQSVKIKDLPMPVDVHVGYNWGDIENDDIENIFDYEVN